MGKLNILSGYTPGNERMSPKQGPVSIGNTSEPTMDFQGSHMLVFRGSKQVNHSKLGNILVGPTKDTSTYLLENGGIFKWLCQDYQRIILQIILWTLNINLDESEYFKRFKVIFGRIPIQNYLLDLGAGCLVLVISRWACLQLSTKNVGVHSTITRQFPPFFFSSLNGVHNIHLQALQLPPPEVNFPGELGHK